MRAPRLVTVIAAVGIVLAAASAAATPGFPDAIAAHLAAPTPPCSVCHQGGVTGRGTVSTPFGQAMVARGLVPYDEASLTTALDALAAEGHDSNGNGVSDVDELKAGDDPNAGAGDTVVPTYGCLGSVAGRPPGRGGRGALTALALGLLLAAGSRRHRRSRRLP
jgi:hypothetical protein